MDTTPQRAKHAAPRVHGRRRAADPVSDPTNIAPLTQSIPAVQVGERRQALQLERELVKAATTEHQPRHSAVAVAATTGLVMLSAMSGTIANATVNDEASKEPSTETTTIPVVDSQDIRADEHQVLINPKVEVRTEAAPPPPSPPAVEEAAPPAHVAVAPPAAPAPVFDSGKAAIIAYSAKSQIGVWQDCTMLVTNSLKAVGIYFHGWPWEYLSLGHEVSSAEAIPGDLLYYAPNGSAPAHIAVYIGNGRAIHGGWNGNQTIEWSVNVGYPSYPPTAYIRVH